MYNFRVWFTVDLSVFFSWLKKCRLLQNCFRKGRNGQTIFPCFCLVSADSCPAWEGGREVRKKRIKVMECEDFHSSTIFLITVVPLLYAKDTALKNAYQRVNSLTKTVNVNLARNAYFLIQWKPVITNRFICQIGRFSTKIHPVIMVLTSKYSRTRVVSYNQVSL